MKLKTAQEAYEATTLRQELITGQTLRNIATKINEAIVKGKYSVDIHESVGNEVLAILIENGYNVKCFHDQREGDTVTISWNKS